MTRDGPRTLATTTVAVPGEPRRVSTPARTAAPELVRLGDLQSAAGNRAVADLLRSPNPPAHRPGSSSPCVQRMLYELDEPDANDADSARIPPVNKAIGEYNKAKADKADPAALLKLLQILEGMARELTAPHAADVLTGVSHEWREIEPVPGEPTSTLVGGVPVFQQIALKECIPLCIASVALQLGVSMSPDKAKTAIETGKTASSGNHDWNAAGTEFGVIPSVLGSVGIATRPVGKVGAAFLDQCSEVTPAIVGVQWTQGGQGKHAIVAQGVRLGRYAFYDPAFGTLTTISRSDQPSYAPQPGIEGTFGTDAFLCWKALPRAGT